MEDDENPGQDGVALKFLHAKETIWANASYAFWERQPTSEIVESLRPGASAPLTVKLDGTIVDGNTRAWILRERHMEVDSLPRVIFDAYKMEDFDG